GRGLLVPAFGLGKVAALADAAQGIGGERLAADVVGGGSGRPGALEGSRCRAVFRRARRLQTAVAGGERRRNGGVGKGGRAQRRPPAAGKARRPGHAGRRLGGGQADTATQNEWNQPPQHTRTSSYWSGAGR